MRNTQDCIEDEMQRDLDWQDRQVWCAKCEKHIRAKDRWDRRHPQGPELCRSCQEDADLEAEAQAEDEMEMEAAA
jgi:hypothetical protein